MEATRNFLLKFDKDQFYKGLTPFMTFWKKLNQGHEFLSMANEVIETQSSAIQIFIKEEFNYALRILRTVHQCFATLNKMCKGLACPHEKEIDIAIALMKYEVSLSKTAMSTANAHRVNRLEVKLCHDSHFEMRDMAIKMLFIAKNVITD